MKNKTILIASMCAMLLTACGQQEKETVSFPEQSVETTTQETTEKVAEETTEETAVQEKDSDQISQIDVGTPVTVNGKEFTITTEQAYPDDEDIIKVFANYGDDSLELDEVLDVTEAYHISTDQAEYVAVETSTFNDYRQIYVLKIADDKMEQTDLVDGGFCEVPQKLENGFPISSKVDVLGSYSGVRIYYLKNDKLETEDTMYSFINPIEDYTITLKLTGEVNCRLDGGNTTLKAGDEIIPKAYSTDGTFYFELQDGTMGNFIVDLDADGNYCGTIGGVSEMDLFENLPYAG